MLYLFLYTTIQLVLLNIKRNNNNDKILLQFNINIRMYLNTVILKYNKLYITPIHNNLCTRMNVLIQIFTHGGRKKKLLRNSQWKILNGMTHQHWFSDDWSTTVALLPCTNRYSERGKRNGDRKKATCAPSNS